MASRRRSGGSFLVLPLHYTVGSSVIGRGAFGEVLGGHDTRSGMPIAVKTIALDHEEQILSVLREITIMRSMRGHSNVLSLHDAFLPSSAAKGPSVCLVLPRMDTSLGRILDSKQELTGDHITAVISARQATMEIPSKCHAASDRPSNPRSKRSTSTGGLSGGTSIANRWCICKSAPLFNPDFVKWL